MEQLRGLLSFGNTKLPNTTAIFNLGSATECPSKALGLCQLAKECYAMKAERQYPACKPYRDRQLEYWKSVTAKDFATDFEAINKRRRIKVTALRINESGDFYSQEDVDKLEEIAGLLRDAGIRTYVYTARADLAFTGCQYLNVLTSFRSGKAEFIGTHDARKAVKEVRASGRKAIVCPADCKKCSLCQVAKDVTIFAEIH